MSEGAHSGFSLFQRAYFRVLSLVGRMEIGTVDYNDTLRPEREDISNDSFTAVYGGGEVALAIVTFRTRKAWSKLNT